MRMSDWSSDVCSSDLLASPHNKRGPRAGADARRSGLMRHVAIVGSGPAGYYTAETLQKADDIAADVIDRLPVPHGWIRTGGAPRHRPIKSLSRRPEGTVLSATVIGRQARRDIGSATR